MDHPNPNIHRGDGTSGRGLLIAFAVIVAIVAVLALVGSIGGGGDGTTGGEAVITPIAPTEQAPAPLPAE